MAKRKPLLLRLFVKDYENTGSPAVRASVGILAGAVGIGSNLLLAICKLLVGWLSASVSVTADALNNLSDAASSIVTLIGFRLAKRPADKDHPYGHGRYEYLAGLAVSVLILFIGFELMKSAVGKILAPETSGYTWQTLVILLLSIGVKLWMGGFFSRLGRHIDSATLRVTALDCRNDVITTVAVLAGCLCEYVWQLPADGYIGLCVALFILYSGLRSAKETISPLLGAQADEAMIRQLSDIVLSHDKILGIHDLLVHDYGPGRCYASVHAEVSAQLEPLECHDLLDHIEAEVSAKLQVQLVIHFDPITQDDPELNQLQETISQILGRMNPALTIHDLRVVQRVTPPLICFDLTAPYAAELNPDQLADTLKAQLPPQWQDHKLTICIDRV